jgi:hypothetical protein
MADGTRSSSPPLDIIVPPQEDTQVGGSARDAHTYNATGQPAASALARASRTSSIRSIEPTPIRGDSNNEKEKFGYLLGKVRLITFEPLPPLKWQDVSALIITKMVGTGILTGPPLVLEYTGSKRIAIGLWVGGFVYTLVRSVHPDRMHYALNLRGLLTIYIA